MINIFNLNYKRDEKEIKKVETYRKILEKIHVKIKNNSKETLTHLVYIIPKYVAGLPAYDQIKCAEYCYDRLKKNGFIVLYTYPNMLYVSWDHVPSKLKNPDVKPLEYEFATNPYKDYSQVVYQISNIMPKTPQLEYISPSTNQYSLSGSNPDLVSNDYSNSITYNNNNISNSSYNNTSSYNNHPYISNDTSQVRNKTINFFNMLENSK